MKLQIVETSMSCPTTLDTTYKYILTLDDKILVGCTETDKIDDTKVCYGMLRKMMESGAEIFLKRDYLINFKIEDAVRMGIKCIVLFEKEVSNMFLKGLYTESRMEAIKGDFT